MEAYRSERGRTVLASRFWAGARAAIPLCLGIAPYGVVVGLLGPGAGLGRAGTLATSLFVYAGSAQFLAIGLLRSGTAYALIVLTTGIVNLRHLLYSASMGQRFRGLSRHWRALLSYFLTDECYATLTLEFTRPGAEPSRHFWLGAGLALYLTWVLCTAAGLAIGGRVGDPSAWGLDFTLTATFVGLLALRLRGWAPLAAAIVACVLALVAYSLPGGLGTLLAIVVAATVGWRVEKWQSRF